MTERVCGRTGSWTTDRWRVGRYELPPDHEAAAHRHAADGFVVGLRGALALDFSDRPVPVAEGAIVPLRRGRVHREWCTSTAASCLLIERTGVDASAPDPRRSVARQVPPGRLGHFRTAVAALESGGPTARDGADRVLTGLLWTADARHRGPRERGWLLAAWSRIEARLPGTAAVGRLADEVSVSREHLSRAFRDVFGLPLSQYTLRRRLEYGAARLRAGDGSISSIAFAAGFADQSHFTRHFRSYFGTTPGRYRALADRDRGA